MEMQNTGDPGLRVEVVATVEHVLADRPGDWRVSIIGSQANDRWEMKIFGPNWVRAFLYAGRISRGTPAGGDSGFAAEADAAIGARNSGAR